MSPIKEELTRLTDSAHIFNFTVQNVATICADALAEITRLEKALDEAKGRVPAQMVPIAWQVEAHLERIAMILQDMYLHGIAIQAREA
jgi:hypothetical protein